jgi:hypothetical protein
MKQPIEIRCPKCSAAPGGRCLESVLNGSKYIAEFHKERIEAAKKE